MSYSPRGHNRMQGVCRDRTVDRGARPSGATPQRARPCSMPSVTWSTPRPKAVPTTAFLTVLCHAGYEMHAARQALARAGDAGWISGARRGRESWWSVTESGHQLIEDGIVRIADLGKDADTWDRRWVVVMTTIPHGRRAVRQDLYRYLTWSGFGSPMPGIWVSPFVDREHGAQFAIKNLGLSNTTMSFIGNAGSVGLADDEIVRSPQSTSRDAARELLAMRAAWLEPAREYWNILATDGAAQADESA
jgi:phenylacetic acid degradation operon negative regulatory protein